MAEQWFKVESCIHGYHVYRNVWNPEIGDRLETEVDKLHQHDRYAEGIIENGLTDIFHMKY